MKRYNLFCISVLAVLMTFTATLSFAQDSASEKAAKETIAPAQAPQAPASKEIAIYGEVQAVNAQAGSLSVQYYDYDSDSEKTSEAIVDKDTKIENAAALGDIKKGDWVDVTYTVADGKNTAKSVIVEKEEKPEDPSGTPAAGLPAEE